MGLRLHLLHRVRPGINRLDDDVDDTYDCNYNYDDNGTYDGDDGTSDDDDNDHDKLVSTDKSHFSEILDTFSMYVYLSIDSHESLAQ